MTCCHAFLKAVPFLLAVIPAVALAHGHLISAVPNGYCVETHPNPKRDPLWDTLFTHRAELRGGFLHLSDKPGFGFDIDWKTVDRYRV